MSLDDRDWYRAEMKRRAKQDAQKPGYIHPALRHLNKPHRHRFQRYGPAIVFWSLLFAALFHAANQILRHHAF